MYCIYGEYSNQDMLIIYTIVKATNTNTKSATKLLINKNHFIIDVIDIRVSLVMDEQTGKKVRYDLVKKQPKTNVMIRRWNETKIPEILFKTLCMHNYNNYTL
eukprot:GHVO01007961.1.p1 GENE.GHVO01007961.1~~GHVO01007961.1.p1  ORF type:complete len:103 (+),score=2.70 GHVO01007961.1:360-668(+)